MLKLTEAAIISTSIQGMLFGFSLLMFILTMWILLRNRTRRRLNVGMMVAACTLILLATAEFIVNIIRVCQGFLNIGPNIVGGSEQYFLDVTQVTFVAKSCLYNVQTLILDGVVIYRTYVVWQSVWVVIIPMLGWCGLLATTIGTNVNLATARNAGNIFAAQTGRWITGIYAITLATNLSATLLLAFRIWQVDRSTRKYRSHSKLAPVLRVVVESGAIYSMTITAALVCFVVGSPGVYVLLDMISPIISIVFNMIIIRVGFASDRKIATINTTQYGLDGPTSDGHPSGPHNHGAIHFSANGGSGNGRRGISVRNARDLEMNTMTVELTRYLEGIDGDNDNGSLAEGKGSPADKGVYASGSL